jgi:hypothetical protein
VPPFVVAVPPLPPASPASVVPPASPVSVAPGSPASPTGLAPPFPFDTHFALLQVPPVQGSPSFLTGLLHVPLVVSHVPDSWHSSLGGQESAVPAEQVPPAHLSFWVHGLSSVQVAPSAFVWTQPVAGSQLSVVHGLLSSQPSAVPPPHTPFVHFWACKHLFPLSHVVLSETFVFVHVPVPTLQPSVVHGLLSLQFGPVVGVQTPAAQWSPVEQSFPSEHVFVSTLVWTQPVDGLHESFVHACWSSQLSAVPATQAPLTHLSPTVHAEPSLQASVLSFVNTQPLVGLQLSAVHGLPSLQESGVPGVHTVPLQVSAPLQTLPSEQPVPGVTAVWLHAPAVQASCVHGLVSTQLVHAPPPLPHAAALTLPAGTHAVPVQQPVQQLFA